MSTRLLDTIMRNAAGTKRGDAMRESVKGVIPFIVDNVSQYALDSNDHFTWKDWPNLAPPFSHFWMEYQAHIRERDYQTGALITAVRLPEDRDAMLKEAMLGGQDLHDNIVKLIDDPANDAAKWLLNLVLFDRRSYLNPNGVADSIELSPVQVVGRVQILVRADGERATENVGVEIFDAFDKPVPTDAFFAACTPFFLAISFLHCKNVVQGVRQAPRQERRRAAREKTLAPVTYKTLVIEPMTKVLYTEGGRARGASLKKAMHICRGHFKTFDEKPLFGRHRGMYFWNDQVRNTKSDRAVAKRYSVHAAALAVAALSGAGQPLQPTAPNGDS